LIPFTVNEQLDARKVFRSASLATHRHQEVLHSALGGDISFQRWLPVDAQNPNARIRRKVTFVTIVRAVTAATPIWRVAEFAEHSRSPIQRGKPYPSDFFPIAIRARAQLRLKFSAGDPRNRAGVPCRRSKLADATRPVLEGRIDCAETRQLGVEKLFIDLSLARLGVSGRAADCGPPAAVEPVAVKGLTFALPPVFSKRPLRARSDASIGGRSPIVGTA
jgi:hypothetical protein